MNELLQRQPKFENLMAEFKVVDIQEIIAGRKIQVTVDLTDKNAWIKHTHFDRTDGTRTEHMVPVGLVRITCEYLSPTEALLRRNDFGDYHGWYATIDDIEYEFAPEGEEPQKFTRPGMGRQPNRDLGCMAAKLNLGWDSEGKAIELPEELLAELGDNAYIIHRDDDCGVRERSLIFSEKFMEDILAATTIAGWEVIEHNFTKSGKIKVLFTVPACQHHAACNQKMKYKYFPSLHIPYLGQEVEKATTGATRYLAASVAGMVALMKDPAMFKPGVYSARGIQPKYRNKSDQRAKCTSCIMRKIVGRSNDEEAEMGQSSIAQIKTDGLDPVCGCVLTGEWNEAAWLAQNECNQAGLTGDIARSVIWKAEGSQACERYMWDIRFSGRNKFDADRNPESVGFFRPWIPAARTADFVDNTIVARMPGVVVINDIMPAEFFEWANQYVLV